MSEPKKGLLDQMDELEAKRKGAKEPKKEKKAEGAGDLDLDRIG